MEHGQLSVIREGWSQWVRIDPERWVDVVGGGRLQCFSFGCFHFFTVMESNIMS